MGIFDRFEGAVEKGVNQVFSRVFKSGMKPVDVSSALRAAADKDLMELDDGSLIAPNHYVVNMSPTDYRSLVKEDIDAFTDDLTQNLTDYAQQQGYAFLGPVIIDFDGTDQELTGNLDVVTSTKRGGAAPATGASASPQHPIIDVAGEKWLLTEPVTVIGRGRGADIVVDDTGISRKHVEFRVTDSGVIVTDLGSTNGTYVEGHRVDAATLMDGNQIIIGRTPILFWTHPEPEGGV